MRFFLSLIIIFYFSPSYAEEVPAGYVAKWDVAPLSEDDYMAIEECLLSADISWDITERIIEKIKSSPINGSTWEEVLFNLFKDVLEVPTHANFKLVLENFQECYHCPTAHPELCAVQDKDWVVAMGAGIGTAPQKETDEYLSCFF